MSLLDAVAADPTAQIIVGLGEDTKTFHVNKKLLCECSTYFSAALNNGFAETADQLINLDDEEPDTFTIFVSWLYEGKLDKEVLPSHDPKGVLENQLFRLYIFADKRGIGNLANDIITMLAAYWIHEFITLTEVAWVVRLISRKSKLYELALDSLVIELREGCLFGSSQRLAALNLPKEFLFDLLLRSVELSKQFYEYHACYEAVCHYHCHEGQGIMSEEDCIRNVEAGNNTYFERVDRQQGEWKGDWEDW